MATLRFRTLGTDQFGGVESVDADNVSRYVEYHVISKCGDVYYVDPMTHVITPREPWHIDNDRALIYAIQAWLSSGHTILPGWGKHDPVEPTREEKSYAPELPSKDEASPELRG